MSTAHSGILIVDKPQGVTSHDVVAAVRSALHMKKVGHAGTLDPMATGVLVIGFGNATRLLNYIVDHHKTYEATIRFGQRTTTDDADGEQISAQQMLRVPGIPQLAAGTDAHLPSLEEIRQAVAQRFTGPIDQVPNTYSAIKIHGQRAYDLARAGQTVELEPRRVTIDAFDVYDAVAIQADDGTPVVDVRVRVSCSAGTYIRALGRDLGEVFGCGAHLTRLRRVRVGDFLVDDPHTVTAHTQSRTFTGRDGQPVTRLRAVLDCTGDELTNHELTMLESVERTMPVLDVTADEARDLRFGRWIRCHTDGMAAAVCRAQNDVAAIVEPVDDHTSKPIAVFAA